MDHPVLFLLKSKNAVEEPMNLGVQESLLFRFNFWLLIPLLLRIGKGLWEIEIEKYAEKTKITNTYGGEFVPGPYNRAQNPIL